MKTSPLRSRLEQLQRKSGAENKEARHLRSEIFQCFALFPGKISKEEFSRFVDNLPDEYIHRFSAREIVKHYLSLRNYEAARVVTILTPKEFNYSLTILTGDHHLLLARITQCLVRLFINIREAEIFTHSYGLVLDHFLFSDTRRLLETEKQKKTFQVNLEALILTDEPLLPDEANFPRFIPIPQSQIILRHEILEEKDRAILSMECPDRLGLIYRTARAISETGKAIQSGYVRVSEKNQRTEQLFVILEEKGIFSEEKLQAVRQNLLRNLSNIESSRPGSQIGDTQAE